VEEFAMSERLIRRSLTALAAAFALVTTPACAAFDEPLIADGADWTYLDDGSDQGTAWRETAFDDSTWAVGPAQLGYGDGDEATVVSFGPDAGNKFITTYFRHTFTVADPGAIAGLTLSLLRDDGAVVYLNGTEVMRTNMPGGTITAATIASSTVSGSNESRFFKVAVDAGLLAVGDNVLAVEVHQRSATSSDLSFDARLAETMVWTYLDDGSDQGSAWRETGFDDSTWAAGPGELGYGDGDEATVVSFGPDAGNKFITTYFRHAFEVADAGAIAGLTVSLMRDDGAAAYINGTEMYRTNMPAGTIDYLTAATNAVGSEDEYAYEDFFVPASMLVTGTNILAVEVHQQSSTSSDLSLDARIAEGSGIPTIVRGPYLQNGTPSSLVVRWRTDIASDSRVSFGSGPGNLTSAVNDPALVTDHAVTITGLTADTTYFYAVGSMATTLAGDDADHHFKTMPTAGTVQPIRLWVIGDSGTANADARAVRDAYLAYAAGNPADLWLMLGDNAYNSGTDTEYQNAVFNMYPSMLRTTTLWATLGNHDGINADSATETGPYYDIFTLPRVGEAGGLASGTEAYYSFDYGNIHFVCLESYETNRTTGGPMLTWLANDLASTLQPWIIAFWHHPPYSRGSHNSDFDSRMIQMRQNALPILEAAGVDLVLSGHSHSYERSFLLDGHYGVSATLLPSMILDDGDGREDGSGAYNKPTAGLTAHEGSVYVVAGSSGKTSGGALDHPAMFISLNQLGSMVLDVDGDRLDAVFLNSNGVTTDHFTITKGPGPCIADLNSDGLLDFFDVQAFLNAYSAQDPAADFNNDGLFDFFDVQAFLQAFAAGCP
jgi:calcineurin-like phosphoesterase family protein/purple acid phosphatase-like protein